MFSQSNALKTKLQDIPVWHTRKKLVRNVCRLYAVDLSARRQKWAHLRLGRRPRTQRDSPSARHAASAWEAPPTWWPPRLTLPRWLARSEEAGWALRTNSETERPAFYIMHSLSARWRLTHITGTFLHDWIMYGDEINCLFFLLFFTYKTFF